MRWLFARCIALPELYHGLDDRRLVRESTLSGFGVMTVSFVALRRVAIKAVDGSGLGGSERDPVAPDLLEGREELLAPSHRPGVQLVPALELALE